MIKYCFCFFLCALTINGADEVEEAEPCYELRIIKCGPIKELGEFHDIFNYDSFWDQNKFLPYLHFDQVKLPIVWIDHHSPIELRNVLYFNPRVSNHEDNFSTSYLCYQAVEKDIWIAAVGCIAD